MNFLRNAISNNIIDVNSKNSDGISLLSLACMSNDANMVNFLLEFGAFINIKSKSDFTPLMDSSQRGYVECINLLLAHGADLDVLSKNGSSALSLAFGNGHLNAGVALIARGANVNHGSKVSALYMASQNGHFDCVRYLLTVRGIDIDVISVTGKNALMISCQNGHYKCADILLEKGASINFLSNGGLSSLHFASSKENLKCMEVLLKRKASLNLTDQEGWTALHYASQNGHFNGTELLLSYGALTDVKNANNGYTPIIFASQNGHLGCIKSLISHRASPNLQCNGGFTPLMIACKYNCLDCVEYLLRIKGVDIEIMNNNGTKAIDFVMDKPNFVELFLNRPVEALGCEASSSEVLKEKSECRICLDEDVVPNMCMIPCGHICMCEGCSLACKGKGLDKCPICRTPISNMIKTFQA